MKPILFLGTRAEDAPADAEFAAILDAGGLHPSEVRRLRLEAQPLGECTLSEYAGIIIGGSPFNVSDPEEAKSPTQRRVEAELAELAEAVIDADFPFLGACYGIGTLGSRRGGRVDRTYGEPVGAVPISLTAEGERDRLFAGIPREFAAYVGHKEAVRELPPGVVLLATSPGCPVQAFRWGHHVYATQFHPELDLPGLRARIDAYRHHGYFAPDEAEAVKERAAATPVTYPGLVLANFVALCRERAVDNSEA